MLVLTIPFFALDLELFDFHLFRFSFGETSEEVARNRKSKSYRTTIISNAISGIKWGKKAEKTLPS
jgi:hypothetical protein